MLLHNFTNHDQGPYADFFSKHGFDEVTSPMHPEIKPEMTEEQVVYTVYDALEKLPKIEGEHFLVQGMSNVAHCAITVIMKNGGTAHYVLTEKKRNENGLFVFVPIELREYPDLGKLLGW